MTNRLCIRDVNNHLIVFDLHRLKRIISDEGAYPHRTITVECEGQEDIKLEVNAVEWLRIIKRMEEL